MNSVGIIPAIPARTTLTRPRHSPIIIMRMIDNHHAAAGLLLVTYSQISGSTATQIISGIIDAINLV